MDPPTLIAQLWAHNCAMRVGGSMDTPVAGWRRTLPPRVLDRDRGASAGPPVVGKHPKKQLETRTVISTIVSPGTVISTIVSPGTDRHLHN